MRGWWWSTIIPTLIVLALCGMAIYITGQDNQCETQIDWVGRCQ